MANQYKNKVVFNGTTIIDLSDTTAVQSDVTSGKYFYTASGEKVLGTAETGGGVTRTNIVPEQTVTGKGYLTLTASEVLVAGQNYAYTFDGEERIGTAVAANGNVYVGDVDAFWGNTGGAFVTDGYSMYAFANVDESHTVKIDKIVENGGGSSGGDTSNNPLKGKILAVTGDSICAGAGFTGGYAGIIGSEQEMTVQNIAVGGGTIVNSGSNVFCISESISNLRSDADFILLEGGGNDSDTNITLGTLTSGYDATLDTTTFAGAFENMLKSAIARFPNKKIGYILIHKCAYQFDSRVPNSYYDMVINACKKWGIPYLDLNTQVPPLNYIADLKSTYTANADGYHPNELGYRTFYVPKITAFLNTMLTDNSLINKIVTANGTYLASDDDADGYSSVTVNVPSSGITPTGSINITTNGTHDVTNYASAVVNVSSDGSTPSATKHTIHFDFSDETDTDIDVYYDDALLTTMIQNYTPATYGQKTVILAQLDGVTWYEPANIPLNTQLVDYNAVLTGYTIDNDGNIITSEAWNCVTDYIPIDPTMTFSFKCQQYAAIGFYNTQKNPIGIANSDSIKDSAEDYVASGYLTPSIIPSGAVYIVLRGNSYGIEETLSLIRTA